MTRDDVADLINNSQITIEDLAEKCNSLMNEHEAEEFDPDMADELLQWIVDGLVDEVEE